MWLSPAKLIAAHTFDISTKINISKSLGHLAPVLTVERVF